MSIYIAHRHRKTSNALDTLVLSEQECFQWTSERLVTARRITEVSRQRIPSHWSSDSEGPMTKWAESVFSRLFILTFFSVVILWLVVGWVCMLLSCISRLLLVLCCSWYWSVFSAACMTLLVTCCGKTLKNVLLSTTWMAYFLPLTKFVTMGNRLWF